MTTAAAHRPTIAVTRHAIAAGHYLAATAGFAILEAGGNAIDAGCAAGMALGVVQSDLVDVAGVAPIMIYLADEPRGRDDRRARSLAEGARPRAVHARARRQDPEGRVAHRRAGGARCLDHRARAATGTMSFGEVAAAAIRLARDGFPMYPLMAESLKRHEADHRVWPSSAAIFLPNGRLPEAGELFRQTDLAGSLQYMADEERAAAAPRPRGRARSGARRLLPRRHRPKDRRLHEAGGRAALGRGSRRVPLAGRVRPSAAALATSKSSPAAPGARVRYCCRPWPCSKGIDLAGLGHNSADYIHHLTEALKLAFADREAYYGDPAMVEVPLATLISSGIRRRAAQADPLRPRLARDAAARRSRPRRWRVSARAAGDPEPRARHLLCLRRRPLRQSVLGDAERRLLRLAGGAGDRAHPVEPRLAIASRPAPSGRASPPASDRV